MKPTKILFIAGCSALLIGCGGGNAPDYEMGKTTGEDVKEEISEAYETAKDYAAEKRDEMQAKISKQNNKKALKRLMLESY